MSNDGGGAEGVVTWELRGPDGKIKEKGVNFNVITAIGDRRYAEAGAGLAGAPAVPSGMKLGTGTTAASKTGAGAAVVTYLTNSHQGFDGGTAASADNGSGLRRIRYVTTFAAGKATTSGTPIGEAVMVNEGTLTNAASPDTATISRVLITPTINKGSADTLTITWDHTIGSLAV